MPGYSLNEAQTSMLADVAASCSTSTDEPVDWDALETIKRLLHADDLSLGGYCIRTEHIWFEQCLPADDPRSVLHETPAEQSPFWQEFWQSTCSQPDRTGDYESVTTASDVESLPETRAWSARFGVPYEREIMACMPLTPGRHLRLLGWRGRGSDFTDRDRFHLALLRPHLAWAYLRWERTHPAETPLTARQLAVMSMVRDGMTNLQIAHRLHLSEGTVRTHLANIFDRLGVSNRTSAVQAVYSQSA